MYLVTGGAGFIGSNIVAALERRGARVVVVDRLGENEKWQNLAKRELEDILPPEELGDALEDYGDSLQAVIHMGAISATTERDGDRLLANNYHPSRALWDWCAEARVQLIYASSAATYGDGSQGFEDGYDPDHLASLRPLNGYGWSKQIFDRWVARRVAEGEAAPPHWVGLKFFNVYGPNEYHKGGQASVAWHLFQQIRRGEAAKLFKSHHPDYADGEQLRDFVHVDDCVEVVLACLDGEVGSGLFNVGTGRARTFLDLAKAVFAAMDEKERIEFIPTPEAIRDKYQYFTQASFGRLRGAGYTRPFTELEDGVRRYVQDFLLRNDPYI
jgi:ADP-L-glycero-D-manno-heptose 6-epimerase